jgi:hypothetical protein
MSSQAAQASTAEVCINITFGFFVFTDESSELS